VRCEFVTTGSPDSTQIAYVHNETVWVMNADGTGTFRTGTSGGAASEVLAPSACVSQDAPLAGYITG
jgi:hypothetical protein